MLMTDYLASPDLFGGAMAVARTGAVLAEMPLGQPGLLPVDVWSYYCAAQARLRTWRAPACHLFLEHRELGDVQLCTSVGDERHLLQWLL